MDTPYEKLLENLARAEVSFILVGGVAVALNGFVRTTEDVDILIERSPENVARLLDALSGFGEGHARDLRTADFDEAEGAIRIIEDFPLDVFTVMRGKLYADLIHSVRQTRINDVEVNYLNAEALISLKKNSKREKDRIDVSALRGIMCTRVTNH
jgi:predicted nucleotidyltransferase